MTERGIVYPLALELENIVAKVCFLFLVLWGEIMPFPLLSSMHGSLGLWLLYPSFITDIHS